MIYLNGSYVSPEDAKVPVEDRGYQFADGIYEVIFSWGDRYAFFDRHFRRLERSAAALDLSLPFDPAGLETVAAELLRQDPSPAAILYLQVTRGVAPREHKFPPASTPTVVAYRKPMAEPGPELASGAAVVTVQDRRWLRCDIKSVSLLPNVLAKQEAVRRGAKEAVLVRAGTVTECSSANLFLVKDRVLWTHPEGHLILSGITRGVVLEEARRLGIAVRLEGFGAEALFTADELFLTSSTNHVRPVTVVNGRKIAEGMGPVTAALQAAYFRRLQAETGIAVPTWVRG